MQINGISIGLSDREKADIVRACAVWWDVTGRHLVNPVINQKQDAPDVRTGGKRRGSMPLPNTVSRAPVEADLNDGILLGRKWDDLTPGEKVRCVSAYVTHKVIPDRHL